MAVVCVYVHVCVCLCRALQQGLGATAQLPISHALSSVHFDDHYVDEDSPEDGMFCRYLCFLLHHCTG